MSDFMSALQNEANHALPNESVTENGALGYKTTGKKLVDLNFMLSSMRNMSPDEIWIRFAEAYNENPTLAVLWLFFARDVREGCGERRVFRIIFNRFCYENDDAAIRLLELVPEYGRWDDLVNVFTDEVPCNIRDKALKLIKAQLERDVLSAKRNLPISLLSKWLPSANTSSPKTKRDAEMLRSALGMTPRFYRKTLSTLRSHLNVVEVKMSSDKWSKIDYEGVPSRAAMNYRAAFYRHDPFRYDKYLNNVKSGKAKIHSGVLYPYDIVHAYKWYQMDNTLEEQWKALPNKVPEDSSTLVVVDGSGSMGTTVGNSGVTCHDVANSLGIYFAEKLKGPYYNSFITFSENPQYVHFADGLSLLLKLRIMYNYAECSNTNIEKVFNLVLDTAVKNHLKQSDLPTNILIISDMEFDEGTDTYGCDVDQKLFDSIAARYAAAGYHLPRLVFWNVCSRTGTIPVKENEFGVALVSGFSPNIADMVMSSKLDPYECLVDKLMSDRYKPVLDAMKE